MEVEALAEPVTAKSALREQADAGADDAEPAREEVYAFDGWGMVPLELAPA